MNVAIVSGADRNFRAITDITWPTHVAYAKRHGYTVIHHEYPFTSFDPPSWKKLPRIRAALETHSWVVWVDADAAFLPDADALPLRATASVLLAYQLLEGIKFPSCGVMALQRNRVSDQWLYELERLKPAFLRHPWWEQAAAYRLMGYSTQVMGPTLGDPFIAPTVWTPRIGWLPRTWHSTPQDPVEAAHLFHATGGPCVPVDTRVAQLTTVLSPQ